MYTCMCAYMDVCVCVPVRACICALNPGLYAQFLRIMLLSNAQKLSLLCSIYIMLMTTAIMPQFVYDFIFINNKISMVRLQINFIYCFRIQCSCFWPIMLIRKLVHHFVPN